MYIYVYNSSFLHSFKLISQFNIELIIIRVIIVKYLICVYKEFYKINFLLVFVFVYIILLTNK